MDGESDLAAGSDCKFSPHMRARRVSLARMVQTHNARFRQRHT